MADQLHQPGWENGFYQIMTRKIGITLRDIQKIVSLRDNVNIDDYAFYPGGGAVKEIAPSFFKTKFQKYKSDFWKYVYLRLFYRAIINLKKGDSVFNIEFSSMFSDTVELRFEALKHMIETDCYTPFDAALLWVLYSPDGGKTP